MSLSAAAALGMPSLRPSLKLSSAAKHRGRATSRYSFDIGALKLVSGLPARTAATGLIVQCSRGPKISATKEVELSAEAKEVGGGVSWERQTLSFVATLFASKSGKATGFSDKRYKVAVLAVKPTFGTSKRVLKELASADINISDYVQTDQPQPVTLRLDRRSNDGVPVVLELSVRARALKVGEGGDDDDDDESISSALTGFSSLRPDEPEVAASHGDLDSLEQDLDGFGESLAVAGSTMFKRSVQPPDQPRDDGAGASTFNTPVAKPVDRNPFGAESRNPFEAGSSRAQLSEAERNAAAAFSEDEDEDKDVAHRPGPSVRALSTAPPSGAFTSASAATRLAPAPDPPSKEPPLAAVDNASPEMLAVRVELAQVLQQLGRAQEEARTAKALADERKRRLVSEQEERDKERARLRAELNAAIEERDGAAAKAEGCRAELAAVRKAGEAEAEARKARDRAKSVEGRKSDQAALDAAVAAASAVASAASAGQVASLRAELAAAQKQALKAQAQGNEMMLEMEEMREELESTAEQVEALQASHRESDSKASRSATADGDRNSEEVDHLSTLLIEAKMAAAQYAFERDEARQKAKTLMEEIQGVQGSGKKLAERATRFEVKFEALREQYDADLAGLIELRLVAAETKAKLAEYEAKERSVEADLT